MIKKEKHTRIKIVFLIAIIALMLLSLFSYLRIRNLIDESVLVNHTQKIKLELNKTLSILQEVESNQRGYIFTKDSVFLPPVDSARIILTFHLDNIARLTNDNQSQVQNALQLRTVVFKRLDYLQKMLNDAKISNLSTQRFLTGRKLMSEVGNQIREMEKEEDKLLQRRTSSMNKSASLTPLLTILLIIGSILILVSSYIKIIKELRISDLLKLNIESTKNELELTNKELAFQNKEKEKRAAELIIANKELIIQNEEKEKRAAELIIANYARSLIEASLDPLVTISASGKILDVNEASIKVTGVPRESLIDTDFSDYFTEPQKAQEGYRQVFKKGFVADYPLTIRHKNGNQTDVLYNASVYKDDQGNVLGVFAAARDVTEQKWAKDLRIANKELAFQNEEKEKRAAELIIANKELVFQNEEKEKRATELILANKELESFTYISSHDLQEPLRQIQNFSSRILANEQKSMTEKAIVYFEKINNAANRMQVLIADLLAYSRTTFAERKFEIIDLRIIAEQVKSEFEEVIEVKNAKIEISEMCLTNVIPFQMRQLLHNLLGNALKFSNPDIPPHIKITSSIITFVQAPNISLNPEKEYCHISITDNGIGFEPQYKDRIFEVFQRLHDKQKISGTGIGLAIVKKIVENHNGFITATSQLNEGATFDVYIPNN